MQAWFARQYGGPEVLRLEETTKPVPGPGQLLVRVHATTVNSGDRRIRACDFPAGMKLMGRLALGWNRPRQPILGTELSGVVEAVGQGVSRFRPGEEVYAFPGIKPGAHAQYAALPEAVAAPLPATLDFDQAAALCFGGTAALHYLRAAGLKPGQSILVLGGSGAVGLALVQLARHQGAEVTATTSRGNAALVAAYGAHTVLDKTAPLTGQYDIVADTVAAIDFSRAQKLLKPGGRYLAIAGALREMLAAIRPGANGTKMIAGPASERPEDIATLGRLAGDGHYRPYVDRVFAWSEMPEAHAYVDTGRKRGSVVVRVGEYS